MEKKIRKVVKSREQIEAEKNASKVAAETPEMCEARQLNQLSHEILLMNRLGVFKLFYTPVRILKNGEATVVFWLDGSKTVVKPADGIAPNEYEAFTAALAKKIFGNNSALKKVMQRTTVIQEPKRKKKKAEPECVFSGTTDETLPCESCYGTPSYSCPAARFPGDEGMEEPNEADRD